MPHDHSKKIAKLLGHTIAGTQGHHHYKKIQMFLKVSDQIADIYKADLKPAAILPFQLLLR